MRDVKKKNYRKKAGLLFYLLDGFTRVQVSKFLTEIELNTLNAEFRNYRKSSPGQKKQIEWGLHSELRRSHLPLFFFAAGMLLFIFLLILHSYLEPSLSQTKRLEIFSPFLIGVFSPLASYFISPFRFRILFRSRITFEKWTLTFITFMALLWTIVYIRIEDALPAENISGLSLTILTMAAISAPFAEEILFREAFPALIGNYPHYAGHLISALIFSLAHIPSGPYMGFLYMLSALFLSTLRLNTDSLLYPCIAHSFANVISFYI